MTIASSIWSARLVSDRTRLDRTGVAQAIGVPDLLASALDVTLADHAKDAGLAWLLTDPPQGRRAAMRALLAPREGDRAAGERGNPGTARAQEASRGAVPDMSTRARIVSAARGRAG